MTGARRLELAMMFFVINIPVMMLCYLWGEVNGSQTSKREKSYIDLYDRRGRLLREYEDICKQSHENFVWMSDHCDELRKEYFDYRGRVYERFHVFGDLK